MATAPRPISSLRWWIGGLLFASTVINYIDRQTLSLLAPYLKLEYHWTDSNIAGAVAPFLVLWIYFRWGWRPAFMVPGALGFLWLIVWRWLLSLVAARKAPIIYGGIGMTLLIPILFSTKLWVIAFLFGVVTFTYAAFTTMANVLPSDLFSSDSVASVNGLSGTGAVIGYHRCFQAHWSLLRCSPGHRHAFL